MSLGPCAEKRLRSDRREERMRTSTTEPEPRGALPIESRAYPSRISDELLETSSMRVTSARDPTRIGGPQYPVPLLT